jgi:hypothetical protein
MVDRLRTEPSNAPELAIRLFNQQLWCWGQDIECACGNLLVRYGFERTVNPEVIDSPSHYRCELSDGLSVILRGFGVLYTNCERSIFVKRYGFRPLLLPEGPPAPFLWSVDDLPSLHAPTDLEMSAWWQLTLDLIDWIREYELWVVAELGIEYRREALEPWARSKPTAASAEAMPSMWRWIGHQFSADPMDMLAKGGRPISVAMTSQPTKVHP